MGLTPNSILRTSLRANPKWLSIWKHIINRIQIRLGLSKRRLLIMVERMCFIKMLLSSLFLYYMSMFLMPKRVARVITSIRKRFLLYGDFKDKKIYKVVW